jgi:hypothetical protein
MAQITTYFTSSGNALTIDGLGELDQVAYFIAPRTISSNHNMAWSPDNRSLSLNGPETRGSTLVIAGNSATDATSSIDVRTSLTYGDITVFKVYDNGRIDSQVLSGTGTGARGNVGFGMDACDAITTGQSNTGAGVDALTDVATGSGNNGFGRGALQNIVSTSNNIGVGVDAGAFTSSFEGNDKAGNSIYIGNNTLSGNAFALNFTNEIVIGHGAVGLGENTTVIGNGSCLSCVINGNVVPSLGISMDTGTNITLSTSGAGTQIGTGSDQKLAFWNATPKVQPATGNITAAAYSHVNSNAIHTNDTFGGYTLAQVVGALRQIGILA